MKYNTISYLFSAKYSAKLFYASDTSILMKREILALTKKKNINILSNIRYVTTR